MRRVPITAGASGVGREIARAFAAEGSLVFVVDLDAKGLSAKPALLRDGLTSLQTGDALLRRLQAPPAVWPSSPSGWRGRRESKALHPVGTP